MSKPTPGPWFVSRDSRPDMEWNNHIACVNEPHIEICAMFHTNDKDDNAEGEANASLIAAAPDGLEAADIAYIALCQIPHNSLSRMATDYARARLRNFIAKATGRDEEEVQNEYESRALTERPQP